jgi:hypothetical protein
MGKLGIGKVDLDVASGKGVLCLCRMPVLVFVRVDECVNLHLIAIDRKDDRPTRVQERRNLASG